jgi:deazaflavin-dependent oxidoreductase (nitroreductase family)
MDPIQPPQPIPYPDHPILKSLYRFPILLYRLGLGPLIGRHILILSTYGRKTGKVRRTPVEFYQHKDQIYVMSGFADKPDWYRNLQENPQAGLNLRSQIRCARARKPETDAEWEGVIAFLKSSPVAELSTSGLVHHLDDPEIQNAIKNWPIFTFDTSEAPCPPPLETELVWVWPLIFLAAALILLLSWLGYRKHV